MKRVKNILILLITIVAVVPVWADEDKKTDSKEEKKIREERIEKLTAREAFWELQCPALEMLNGPTRLDMLDYWDADSVYKATNTSLGLSWIEELTPDYIRVRITPVSVWELKVLPYKKKDKVLMSIYTVGDNGQAADSEVTFYDIDLHSLPLDKYFSIPQLKDFFEIPKGSITKMSEIEEMIPFPTIEYKCSAASNDVEAFLTVKELIGEDEWNIVKLFLKPKVTMVWKDKYKVEKSK